MHYRTKDLALAAFLNHEGHAHERLEVRGLECLWVFPIMDSLEDLVSLYMAGDAKVNPKGFLREVATVRNEMYAFLDGQGKDS